MSPSFARAIASLDAAPLGAFRPLRSHEIHRGARTTRLLGTLSGARDVGNLVWGRPSAEKRGSTRHGNANFRRHDNVRKPGLGEAGSRWWPPARLEVTLSPPAAGGRRPSRAHPDTTCILTHLPGSPLKRGYPRWKWSVPKIGSVTARGTKSITLHSTKKSQPCPQTPPRAIPTRAPVFCWRRIIYHRHVIDWRCRSESASSD